MKKVGLFILLLVFIVSCSKKIIYHEKDFKFGELSEKMFFNKIGDYDKIDINTVNYNRFSATHISPDNKSSFKGFLRLRTDSVVMVSVSPALGIEIMRIQVKTDTIGLIDRYNKTYSVDALNLMQKKFGIPINFPVFQSLFLGSLPRIKLPVKPSFKSTSGFYSVEYYFNENQSNYSVIYYFSKNLELKKIEIQDFSSSRNLTVDYKSWFVVNNTAKLPSKLAIQLMNGNRLEILNIDFNEPKINEILNFPFSISDKYERVYY
jgi:hypothetical protein